MMGCWVRIYLVVGMDNIRAIPIIRIFEFKQNFIEIGL